MASKNNERAKRAVDAMKPLGFSRKLTVEVLKRLVSVYSSNWELIEDDNYRVLADAILDAQENANEEDTGRSKEPVLDRSQIERPVRPRPSPQENQDWTPPVKNHYGACEPGPSSSKRRSDGADSAEERETESGAGLVVRKRLRKNSTIERESVITGTVQREIVPVITGTVQREIIPVVGTVQREIVPPFPTERDQRSTQVGTSQTGTSTVIDPVTGEIIEYQKFHLKKKKSNKMPLKEPKIEPGTETEMLNNGHSADNRGNQTNQNSMTAGQTGTELHLGSSKNGQIKLAFQFPVFNNNTDKPSLDEFFKSVENRYLESFNDYRILNPGFSVRGFMNEMCELMADEMKGKMN